LSSEKLAFALRPGVFSPSEIQRASTILEENNRVAGVFVPDGRGGYEAIEISSSILASTRRLYAGSGVIRLLEHDPGLLARRAQTIQAFSSNRLILGVGTGSPGPQPGKTIMAMLDRIGELEKAFQSFPSGVEAPEVYVAALKSGIATRAVGKADGLLLNFCTPQHAARLIETVKRQMVAQIEFACYLKIFYSSKSDETAQRLMVQEFLNYDSTSQYHEMFVQDGTAEAIAGFRKNDDWKKGKINVPKELLKVSLANPTDDELHKYVGAFQRAGVTLPVLYPYFPTDEKSEFKERTVKRIAGTA
jgi:alkanesulfonate monooxygenase SsuD/methylene tetrahydromethanopterin reductase-like flavin-dependent oxidoreductase (luciferase family)